MMLGLATPKRGQEAEQAQRMEAQCEGLPNVFFVKNASLFVGDLVTPEQEETRRSQARRYHQKLSQAFCRPVLPDHRHPGQLGEKWHSILN